jgi:hypothetical protein
MSSQGLFESRKHRKPLLAQGREIAADATEASETLFGAEATGDLLLDFDHAQIALCLVVAKGHSEIDQERQHLPFVLRKPIQQIASGMLFGVSSTRFFDGNRGRIGLIPQGQEDFIASMEAAQRQDIQFPLARGLRSFHCRFHLQQQFFHLPGPILLVVFFDEGQFAQMMHIAQGMLTGIRLVGRPAIMHDGSLVVGHDPNGIERLSSSFEMGGVMGELVGPTDMHPAMGGADAHRCFIQVDEWLLMQRPLELLLDGSQGLIAVLEKARDAACRELDPQHILEDLASAGVGNDLTLNQIHGQRRDPLPILGGSLDPSRKAGAGELSTVRTAFLLHPMLLDPQPFVWQVQDLATFGIAGRLLPQVVLTVLTSFHRMDQHFIRNLDLLEMMTAVATLSTWLLATLLPQTLGRAHEVIRGGRQVTIMAIFGFLPLQFIDPRLQKVDRQQRLLQPCSQGLVLVSQLLDLFVFGHTRSVVTWGFLWQLGNPPSE